MHTRSITSLSPPAAPDADPTSQKTPAAAVPRKYRLGQPSHSFKMPKLKLIRASEHTPPEVNPNGTPTVDAVTKKLGCPEPQQKSKFCHNSFVLRNPPRKDLASGKDPDSLIDKYVTRVNEVLKKDTLCETGQLFEDIFTDLEQQIPEYARLFKAMKQLAVSIKEPPLYLRLSKGIYAETQLEKERTLDTTQIREKLSPLFPDIENGTRKMAQVWKRAPGLVKSLSPIPSGAKGGTKVMPKLDLKKLALEKIKDYNEEFLENINVFSDSWRRNAQDMKTFVTMDQSNL